jgi:hypothetical protein
MACPEEREWLEIRDLLLGENDVATRDIPGAILRAGRCSHRDAQWLFRSFAGKPVSTIKDVRLVLSALGEDDSRVLCFSWWFSSEKLYLTPLRISAQMGYAFAQASLAARVNEDRPEAFHWASLSAA